MHFKICGQNFNSFIEIIKFDFIMSSEEEDMIVEEMPVYLSKNLQENLFILQYPTKTRADTLDKASVRGSYVKSINQEIKVEFNLDTSSSNFDSFKAEKLAVTIDSKSRAKGTERPASYSNSVLDTQTYLSSRLLTDPSKYVVGIIGEKEIHLTPLQNILQMRPSFPHFNNEDKRTKAEQKRLINANDDEEEELQQVTVKFARTGANNKKNKERQDLVSFLKQRKEEQWRKTLWHPRSSPTAELERQKLYATSHEISQSLNMEADKYAKKLLPDPKKNQGIDAVLPPRVISKMHLKELSLAEQLKILLRDVKMMATADIVSFLQKNVDPSITLEKVLRCLPQVALLLRGNWIPQSEVLYPNETVSNANGVVSEIMVRARDYVIYKFANTTCLRRPDVIAATRLPAEEATEVLTSVARVNSLKTWELLLPPDKKFEQRHPELVQRQEQVWKLCATENLYNEMDREKSPKRVRKRSVREAKQSTAPIAQPLQHQVEQQSTSDAMLTSQTST